jgi:hypothetical protein
LKGGIKSLQDRQEEKIKSDLYSVKGTLAIENLYLTEEEEKLIIPNALGHISDEEFDKKVMELIYND